MIAKAPTNQVERPDVVTNDAVSVANRIIATAPGHRFKAIGAGPITQLKRRVLRSVPATLDVTT
jgi:hypothetical protein